MIPGDEIRIMELSPCQPGRPTAPLRCKIHVVPLSSNPDYDAVSYVWGDSNNAKTIDADGREHEISPNLDALLRTLRYSDRPRRIWADQICIDQKNVIEKTKQVKLMGDIYSKCKHCFIWLGELPESVLPADIEAVLHLLKYMAMPAAVAFPSFMLSKDGLKNVLAVFNLIHPLRHVWWSRIWTVQEAILPPKKTILWGPHELPWETLLHAMRGWTTQRSVLPRMLSLEEFNLMNSFCASVVWITRGRSLQPPSNLVLKWRGREATNPRDKVFGILGLVPQRINMEFTKRCDYNSTVAEVYSSFTLDTILADQNLEALIISPRLEHDIATDGIPRWAIDMARFPRLMHIDGFYRHRAHGFYKASNRLLLNQPLLRATIAANAGSTNILAVSGIEVDVVRTVSPDRCTAPCSDTHLCQTLQAWYKLAVITRSEQILADIRLEFDEEFCRLVVADMIETDHESKRRSPNQQDLGHVWQFVTTGRLTSWDVWSSRVCKESQLFNQTFFVTTSGMIGVGPWDMLPVDQVWILQGGNYPFVLRPRFNDGTPQFDFIGCCYVQGIMFGELLREEPKVSTQEIYLY